MATLDISATIRIDRSAELVRRQFADVRHHEAAGVHDGVVFEVIEQTAERCHYRQTTRVGPLRLRQELELPLTTAGPLVNTILKGQLAGGTITFTVSPAGTDAADVHAHLHAPANPVLVPLLRANAAKALRRALAEDKADIESGSYAA